MENEQAELKQLLEKLEEEISLSYYLTPGIITVGRDLVQALNDLVDNPDNWEEN